MRRSSFRRRLIKAYYGDAENSYGSSDLNTVEEALFPPLSNASLKLLFGKPNVNCIGDATMFDYAGNSHAVMLDLKQFGCSMDGVDDVLTMSSTFDFNFFASSISFWMSSFEIQSLNPYLFGDSGDAGNYLRIVNGNEIEFSASGTVCYRTLNLNMPDNLQDTNWRHFVVQRDNEDLVLYIDGVLADRIPNCGNHACTFDLIGNFASGTNRFGGVFSDIRFFNTVLTAQQVKNLHAMNMDITDGLVHKYDFDRCNYFDLTIPDTVGSNDITVSGAVPRRGAPLHTCCKSSRPYGNDPNNKYVILGSKFVSNSRATFGNLGTLLSIDGASSITKCIWVKTHVHSSNSTDPAAYMDVERDGVSDFGFASVSGDLRFYYNFNTLGSGSIILTQGLAFDRVLGAQWHHLACTYDGTDLKLYLDGKLCRTLNAPGDTIVHNFVSTLNRRITTLDEQANGGYSDFRIYSNALTQSDIADIIVHKDPSPGTKLFHAPLNDNGTTLVDIVSGNNGTIVGNGFTTPGAPTTRPYIIRKGQLSGINAASDIALIHKTPDYAIKDGTYRGGSMMMAMELEVAPQSDGEVWAMGDMTAYSDSVFGRLFNYQDGTSSFYIFIYSPGFYNVEYSAIKPFPRGEVNTLVWSMNNVTDELSTAINGVIDPPRSIYVNGSSGATGIDSSAFLSLRHELALYPRFIAEMNLFYAAFVTKSLTSSEAKAFHSFINGI